MRRCLFVSGKVGAKTTQNPTCRKKIYLWVDSRVEQVKRDSKLKNCGKIGYMGGVNKKEMGFWNQRHRAE